MTDDEINELLQTIKNNLPSLSDIDLVHLRNKYQKILNEREGNHNIIMIHKYEKLKDAYYKVTMFLKKNLYACDHCRCSVIDILKEIGE